jgi:hypothetical protein
MSWLGAILVLTAKTSKVTINHVDHVLYNCSGPVVVCHDRVESVEGFAMNQDFSFAIGVVVVAIVFLLIL